MKSGEDKNSVFHSCGDVACASEAAVSGLSVSARLPK
jgi:hypothetical protein